MSIPVFSFVAFSGTGKTTFLEKLIPQLKARGLRVAVYKHDAHEFEIDKKGKDSWRFTAAGADVTVISSNTKAAVMENRYVSPEELVPEILLVTEFAGKSEYTLAGFFGTEIICLSVQYLRNRGLRESRPFRYDFQHTRHDFTSNFCLTNFSYEIFVSVFNYKRKTLFCQEAIPKKMEKNGKKNRDRISIPSLSIRISDLKTNSGRLYFSGSDTSSLRFLICVLS